MKYAISDKAELGDGVGEFDLLSNEDVEDEDDLQPVAAAVERPVPVERSAPAPAELAVAVANPVPENPPARAANSG